MFISGLQQADNDNDVSICITSSKYPTAVLLYRHIKGVFKIFFLLLFLNIAQWGQLIRTYRYQF